MASRVRERLRRAVQAPRRDVILRGLRIDLSSVAHVVPLLSGDERQILLNFPGGIVGSISAVTPVMRNRFLGWLTVAAGCAVFVAGCGGSAQDNGKDSAGASLPGAPAGSGNDGQSGGNVGGGAGTPATSSAGSGQCVEELAQVAKTWGDCPATMCAAEAWAANCAPLYPDDMTEVGTCDMLRVITISLGSTHGKDCYYDLASEDGEPKLVGAAWWDDTPQCEGTFGTTNRVVGGRTSPNCGGFTRNSSIICARHIGAPDGSGGSGGSGQTPAAPPARCFSAASHSCEPC